MCRGWGRMGLYMVTGAILVGTVRSRSGPGQVQISPSRSKSEQNRTNITDHPNRPTGPELLQEVVEGLAERLFVGHAAVNEVAVADYVYCRY